MVSLPTSLLQPPEGLWARTTQPNLGSWCQKPWESCFKWKSLNHIWLFVTLWTIVHGILQGRILEWVAYPFSSVSSQSRNRTRVSYIAGGFYQLNHQGVTWEAYLPSNLRNFSNSCLLTLGLGLALQFYYSVTRGGCFIWKLFLGEGKGNLFSIDVPKKGKIICFHLL